MLLWVVAVLLAGPALPARWFYKDDAGYTHGPFPAATMLVMLLSRGKTVKRILQGSFKVVMLCSAH